MNRTAAILLVAALVSGGVVCWSYRNLDRAVESPVRSVPTAVSDAPASVTASRLDTRGVATLHPQVTESAHRSDGSARIVIRGRCIDDEGLAVEGVRAELCRVGATGAVHRSSAHALSSAEGRFELGVSGQGGCAFQIYCRRSGFVPRMIPLGAVADSADIEVEDIVLDRGHLIRIVALDERGPLPEAEVRWRAGPASALDRFVEDPLRGRVVADGAGAASVRLPRGSRVDFRVTHPRCGSSARGPTVYVHENLLESPIEVRVRAAEVLRVRLVDERENPIRNANFAAVHWPKLYGETPLLAAAETADSGRYRVSIPDDCRAGLSIRAPGFVPRQLVPMPDMDRELAISLARGSAGLTVQLVGIDHELDCSVGVAARASRDLPALRRSRTTDGGQLRVRAQVGPFEEGQRVIIMDLPRRRWWRTEPLSRVQLTSPRPPIAAERWAAHQVGLKIVRPDGTPAAGASVVVKRRDAASVLLHDGYGGITPSGVVRNHEVLLAAAADEDGRLQLAVPVGAHLSVQARDGLDRSAVMAIDAPCDETRTLPLVAGCTLRVAATDTTTPRGIQLLRAGEFNLLNPTGSEGRTRLFEALVPGTYYYGTTEDLKWVLDYAPKYRHLLMRFGTIGRVTLAAGASRSVVVEVSAPAWVSGRVLSSEREQVLLVDLLPRGVHRLVSRRQVRLGNGGEFVFGHLPKGEYELQVFHSAAPNRPIYRVPVIVESGTDVHLTVEPRWSRVEVRANGAAQDSNFSWIHVKDSKGALIAVRKIARGVVWLEIARGRYTIEQKSFDHRTVLWGPREIDFPSGTSVVTIE